MSASVPFLGYGLGLRSAYYQQILEQSPAVDWFEVVSENFMVQGGKALYFLDAIAERYPVVMHGVSLSIGGPHALDPDYLKQLKQLADRVKPAWISDHLCWSRGNAHQLHDLLPLPYTEESLAYIAGRVVQVQDVLQRPLVLENVSSYVRAATDDFIEWEFLQALSHVSGCELLLDVNNVYVSSYNHGFDPKAYIDRIPRDRVVQMHLAGHTNKGTHIIDTHNDYVIDTVWKLYRYAHRRLGGVATLLEWDANIPDFEVVHGEALKARKFREQENAKMKTPDLAEVPAYGD